MGVYIAEAHAKDEWPMPCVNSPCRHRQPKSIKQRAEHAKEFIADFRPPFPVFMDSFVDGWTDPFMATFSAWPERFYVFQYSVQSDETDLATRAGKGNEKGKDFNGWCLRWWNTPCPEEGHRIDDIREWLNANVSRPVGGAPTLKRTTSEVLREERRLAKVKEVFKAFDVDNTGAISKERMEALFEGLGYLPETLSAVFKEVDLDRSGQISLEEFEAFFRGIHPSLQKELGKQGRLDHVAGPAQPRKLVSVA